MGFALGKVRELGREAKSKEFKDFLPLSMLVRNP